MALYRGLTPSLLGILPYAGFAFATFETLKQVWSVARVLPAAVLTLYIVVKPPVIARPHWARTHRHGTPCVWRCGRACWTVLYVVVCAKRLNPPACRHSPQP